MKRFFTILLTTLICIPSFGTLRVDIQDVWNGYVVKDSTRNVYVSVEEHYNGNMALTGDSIIISGESGRYKVDYSLSVKSTSTNHEYQLGISKNNNAPDVRTRGFKRLINSEWNSVSMNCILDCTDTDTLRVVVLDTTGKSSIYFKYGNWRIEEITGGGR